MAAPKIFVSSVVTGFENERDAAVRAIQTVHCQPLRCEDFGALPVSPKTACMAGVDEADVVVAVFGQRWGYVPADDNPRHLSVTALEVERARARDIPVLLFLKQVKPADVEAGLRTYLDSLTSFSKGLTYAGFRNPNELEAQVRRSLLGMFHKALLAKELPEVVEPPAAVFQQGQPKSTKKVHQSVNITVSQVNGPVAVAGFGNATALQIGSGSMIGAKPAMAPEMTELTKQMTVLKDDLQGAVNALVNFQQTIGGQNDQLRSLMFVAKGIKDQLDLMWSDIENAASRKDVEEVLQAVAQQVIEEVKSSGKPGQGTSLAKDLALGVLGNGAYELLKAVLVSILVGAMRS